MKEIVAKVYPGGEAVMLYSDDSPLSTLPGRRQMVRASNVVWNEERQRWKIVMPDGTILGDPQGYVIRGEAIFQEVLLLNEMLAGGYTGFDLGFRATDAAMEPIEGQVGTGAR
jgi:hypothetical protein